MGGALTMIRQALPGQRGHLFPWAPVAMACGIALYFGLRAEPPVWLLWSAAAVSLAGLGQRRAGPCLGPLLAGVALVSLGFALAGGRAHQVAGPVLDFRYYGAVEGRIVAIDRSASDAVRLTLDRVVLERMAPAETPARVRVSMHGRQDWLTPEPGATVILTGHLSPPAARSSRVVSTSGGIRGSSGWGRWDTRATRSCCWSRRARVCRLPRSACGCRPGCRRRCRVKPAPSPPPS
ncbi:DUF4131 domain-containing protein [Ponticoccus litoralis]|uniref:DUF4131 domain-containing protein n=1 Tax=Ponticoccus litoralis TaxID=422297 RepID=A0AAW9S7F0_9RHOB